MRVISFLLVSVNVFSHSSVMLVSCASMTCGETIIRKPCGIMLCCMEESKKARWCSALVCLVLCINRLLRSVMMSCVLELLRSMGVACLSGILLFGDCVLKISESSWEA